MVNQSARPLLTRRALILGVLEDTYGTNPGTDPTTDAALVSAPEYTVDPQILTRDFVREDISPLGSRTGRKLSSLSFGMEFRSNGRTQSGALADECMAGRFLRACGYSATSMTGSAALGNVMNADSNTVNPTWAKGGSSVLTNKTKYTGTVVLGGASATAKIRFSGGEFHDDGFATYLKNEIFTSTVTGAGATMTATMDDTDPLSLEITIGGSFHVGDVLTASLGGYTFTHSVVSGNTNNDGAATAFAAVINAHALFAASASSGVITVTFAASAAGVTTTSGSTALNVGPSGMTATPTWTGNLVLGDTFTFDAYPQGIKYLPISDDFESISLEAYFDGVKHELNGCFGTFTINAPAGEYATINFTFTGQYVSPVDDAVPTATHETTLPPIVELSKLILGDGGVFQPVVAAFTFDQNNTITPRPDVNSSDGYKGMRLTARAPSGGIDPEATLVADYNFWDLLAESTQTAFTMRIGSAAGNRILMNAPKIQYTGLTYGDRDGIRVYDAGLNFTRDQGNDEMEFVFA